MKLMYTLLPLLLMTACGSKPAVATAPELLEPEKGQVWQLVRMQGRPLDRGRRSPTLLFNPETGTVTGTAHCNEYTFHYRTSHPQSGAEGDTYELQLTFWGSGSTECPEGEMSAERRYLGLLGKATSMSLTSTTLTLYQKNREVLHYELL
ncbi:MAG: META domain-containing protein [Bacteroidales bacterium]|nr:META domain-containing protein [Bacteroidales bacterium]